MKKLFALTTLFAAMVFNLHAQTTWTGTNTTGIAYRTGKVGIGTQTPSQPLQVEANITGPTGPENRAVIMGYNTYSSGTYNNPVGILGKVNGGTGIAVYGKNLNSSGWGGYFEGKGYFSGNVGIGITSPTYKLHVVGNTKVEGHIYVPSEKRIICGTGFSNGLNLFWHEGFKSSYIDFSPGNLYIRNGNGGVMVLQQNGNVGIGVGVNYTTPGYDHTQGYRLAVNGKILCEGIDGIADVPNSDYVFEEDYNLLSLEEVEGFIKENKHLPEVQSAADFKENGYNMNKFDDLLLRKVEELTLYIIDQEKRIKALEAENAKLKQ